MEAWNLLSALGGMGAFRIWRAAIYFLSSSVVDIGCADQRRFSLDSGDKRLHLDRVGRGRSVNVLAGSPLA